MSYRASTLGAYIDVLYKESCLSISIILTPYYYITEERKARQEAATSSILVRGAKAAVIAGVAVISGHFAAQNFIPQYARVNFRLKAFWGGAACVASFAIAGERQHRENLDRSLELEISKVEAHDAERLSRLEGRS